MTSTGEPKGDPAKSLRFLETFDDRPLPDVIQAETHHELNATFYNSMVDYVIDHKERSSSTSETTEIQEKLETQNMDRVTYVSGNVFEGLASESIPHKTGRLCLDGGAIYEVTCSQPNVNISLQGQFNDGIPEGRGVIRWLDGSWYSGEFLKGLRHGRGLHVSCEDGRRWYSGDWAYGTRNGRGETACCVGQPDGALNYSGDWVDGRPHGSGTASWPDETRYTGGWARGRQHGRGKAVWPSDDVYEGDWIDGHMDGTGTYEWNTNPRDCDRLVLLCLSDKYTGQWSKSKKHGLGVFYSADTGTTVTGRWVDDSLDGPCEIVLSTGRPPKASGLVFRKNVLYEPRPDTPPPANTGHRLAVSTPGRKRRLSYKPVAAAAVDCPLLATYGSRVQESRDFRSTASARLVRADIQLVNSAEGETPCDYDLTDHVLRIADKCREDLDEVTATAGGDLETDLRDAECALSMYDERLAGLYRAYGSFLADGPIPYRPLMTRLGLWQMIVDSRMHEHVSLADFDDLLCEYMI
ncbi:radial spoke head 10 homolog B-like [Metopolophium dirhodum]|uniref:radial spoke head 10 homolog B-like n=1 Tax=Metopolophium dirhodum TaxID=44670 RepID=UPI0029900317|nr:radial spoke head 10 homolog B-like [Metopolophium dirhodum]